MANTPLFVATPKSPQAVVTTANANRDGTGTIVDLMTAGANGSRIDDISIKANGTTTAGMIRLYKHDGSSYRLIREIPVSAIVPSASVASFEFQLTDLALTFQSTHKIAASTHNGESFHVSVNRGGDF